MPFAVLEDVKLRDIPFEIYEQYKVQLPDLFIKRVAHFYTEQKRLIQDVHEWAKGDTDSFGALMFESGNSSFYQQETGISEMIKIFETLKNPEGCYVVRPSGAGFRGTVIGLINLGYKGSIKERIDSLYPEKISEN